MSSDKTGRLRRLHTIGLVVWAAQVPPALIWWHNSIRYVIFISLYTIILDHLIGRQEAKHHEGS